MFIPDLDFFPSGIPDPEVKKAVDPGVLMRSTEKRMVSIVGRRLKAFCIGRFGKKVP
jgi:hypothetical protein